MTFKPALFWILVLVHLAACATLPERYAVPNTASSARQSIAFGSVEIRDISLPAYAASDEISQQDDSGTLRSDGAVLWADTPDRAVALELTRHLAQLSGARMASAPWPFESLPDARLELRFERLIAGDDGVFRATGQFFVAVTGGGRERSGLFDLAVSFDPAQGPPAIAKARGQIIQDLAQFIARTGLR